MKLPAGARRLLVILATVTVIVGGYAVWTLNQEPSEKFCLLGRPIYTEMRFRGELEDGGSPGRGDCDGPDRYPGGLTLGLDCKVRDPDGTVRYTLKPNRSDGTCGIPGDGEDWPG